VSPLFIESGFISGNDLTDKREYLLNVINLLKARCRLITDFTARGEFFFKDPVSYEEKGARKYFKSLTVAEHLEKLADIFDSLDAFTEKEVEEATRNLAEKLDISGGKLIHPARLAVTGMTIGPGLFELLSLVGKERVVSRMRRAVDFIREQQSDKIKNG